MAVTLLKTSPPARTLAAQGMHRVRVARRSDAWIAFAGELSRKRRVQVCVQSADLATVEGSRQVLSEVEDIEVGLLVPGAAVEERACFVECSDYQLESMQQLNVASPMRLVRRMDAISGRKNRLMAWMMSRLMSRARAANMFKLMLKRATSGAPRR